MIGKYITRDELNAHSFPDKLDVLEVAARQIASACDLPVEAVVTDIHDRVTVTPGFLRRLGVGTVKAIVEGRADFVGFDGPDGEGDPMALFHSRMRTLGYDTPEQMLKGLAASETTDLFRSHVVSLGGSVVRRGGVFEGDDIRVIAHVSIPYGSLFDEVAAKALSLGIDVQEWELPTHGTQSFTTDQMEALKSATHFFMDEGATSHFDTPRGQAFLDEVHGRITSREKATEGKVSDETRAMCFAVVKDTIENSAALKRHVLDLDEGRQTVVLRHPFEIEDWMERSLVENLVKLMDLSLSSYRLRSDAPMQEIHEREIDRLKAENARLTVQRDTEVKENEFLRKTRSTLDRQVCEAKRLHGEDILKVIRLEAELAPLRAAAPSEAKPSDAAVIGRALKW